MGADAPLGQVTVVGLGPAGIEYLSHRTLELLSRPMVVLRTRIHPAAENLDHLESYDHLYEAAERFEDVYQGIVDDLVARARNGPVVYAVPGSPLFAERTVELLRRDPRVTVTIEPALSFCDLAWAALGIDPVDQTVTTIDLQDLLGRRDLGGPLLVAQAWSRHLLSELKLLAEELGRNVPPTVTVLHHLGLDDEVNKTVPWEDLDRTIEPDHLTSLYLSSWPAAGASVASLLLVVERLRRECPWDRDQTHQSLGRHLLEESYEVLDALEELGSDEDPEAVLHLEEELGDLLVQVLFHAVLAGEYGGFSLTDIAETVSAKLIFRHPHVFGDVEAATAEEVAANWEVLKQVEKQRSSITDGIPGSLPSLALVAKLQRKSQAIGMEREDPTTAQLRAAATLDALGNAVVDASTLEQTTPLNQEVGELLAVIAQLSQLAGIDPEAALRQTALALRSSIRAFEANS